ncbi:MAG: hypothetical protein LIO68_07080, partial [Rikenellaceae bacterium]|nr:hypothetical protein [Rikenellaceae bacterium]
AYGETLAGRAPRSFAETESLSRLPGVNIRNLNSYWRGLQAQVAFERPELSPCLDAIRGDGAKFAAAVAIIAEGGVRLRERPRADMEGFVPSERHQRMLRKYAAQLEEETANRRAAEAGEKRYDR